MTTEKTGLRHCGWMIEWPTGQRQFFDRTDTEKMPTMETHVLALGPTKVFTVDDALAASPLLPQQGGGTAIQRAIEMAQARIKKSNGWNSTSYTAAMLDVIGDLQGLAAVLPQVGAPRLSDVQIDSIRNTVMIQLATENNGVIGGPDVVDMQFPKRFAEAIMTALVSPVPACGVCGDTGKWHAGYTGLFGGSVPVYETCKCSAAPQGRALGCSGHPRREGMSEANWVYQVRRYCKGDSAWTEWADCSDSDAEAYAKDPSFQVRFKYPDDERLQGGKE